MAEICVAIVAGAARFGGDTRWDMKRAIVDVIAGKGSMFITDLVKIVNLVQAFR